MLWNHLNGSWKHQAPSFDKWHDFTSTFSSWPLKSFAGIKKNKKSPWKLNVIWEGFFFPFSLVCATFKCITEKPLVYCEWIDGKKRKRKWSRRESETRVSVRCLVSTDSKGCKHNWRKMAAKSITARWIVLGPRQMRTDRLLLKRTIKHVPFHSLVEKLPPDVRCPCTCNR